MLIGLAAPGCHKDSQPIISPLSNASRVFPNTLGSQFVYAVFDSISMSSDTVTVTIASRKTLSDKKQVTLWEYNYGTHKDSEYVMFWGDTVQILNKLTQPSLKTILIFPLMPGKNWNGVNKWETYRVIGKEAVTTGAGHFPDAILVEKQWKLLNDYGRELLWFVRDIGFVKKHRVEMGFSIVNRRWELISYQ